MKHFFRTMDGAQIRSVLRAAVVFSTSAALAGCFVFRDPEDLGSYTLCIATGEARSCLNGNSVALKEKTGYWDLTRGFPGVVDGTGTILLASDARGLTRVGNIVECLPDLRSKITRAPPPTKSGKWTNISGFDLRPADFVQLESMAALGSDYSDLGMIKATIMDGDIKTESLQLQEIEEALRAGMRTLNATCRNLLIPSSYMVTESLLIQRVQYAAHTLGGKNIKLSADTVERYFKLNPDYKYTFANGTLVRETPIYVAIRDPVLLTSDDTPATKSFDTTLTTYCKEISKCAKK